MIKSKMLVIGCLTTIFLMATSVQLKASPGEAATKKESVKASDLHFVARVVLQVTELHVVAPVIKFSVCNQVAPAVSHMIEFSRLANLPERPSVRILSLNLSNNKSNERVKPGSRILTDTNKQYPPDPDHPLSI